MPKKFDIGLIAKDPKIIQRVTEIAKSFNYTLKLFAQTDELDENVFVLRILILAGAHFSVGAEFSAYLDAINNGVPHVFKLFIITKNSLHNSKSIAQTKKIDLTLNETEIFETSKPEYVLSQVIRASFLPIKPSDIAAKLSIPFDIYHLLPQQEKFLKFLFRDDTIDQKKYEKIQAAEDLYIHREDAEHYASYIQSLPDTYSDIPNRRCRSQFIALYAEYMKLVFVLTDRNLQGTYQLGIKLFEKCAILANGLLTILEHHPDPWTIIHNSILGDFGSVERGPAVATYAGIVAQKMKIPNIQDIMILSLISELGLLFLHHSITQHLRNDTLSTLDSQQLKEYQNYPQKSVATVLDRKIQLTPAYRNILLGIHERADKCGFPDQKYGPFIPIEAKIIHFAYELDRRTTVRMGKARVELSKALNDLISEELSCSNHFDIEFTKNLHKALIKFIKSPQKPL